MRKLCAGAGPIVDKRAAPAPHGFDAHSSTAPSTDCAAPRRRQAAVATAFSRLSRAGGAAI